MKRRRLADRHVISLLHSVGDLLRDHGGDSAEGEDALRSCEHHIRQVNERLLIHVHYSELLEPLVEQELRKIARHPNARASRRDPDDSK